MTAAELYEADFYAWTQEQAAALRALKGDDRLDVDHLAEEIEDLGKSELHTVESLIEQVIAHLLELDYSAQNLPRNHWRHEIVSFRDSAERRMTPTLRRKIARRLTPLYDERGTPRPAALSFTSPTSCGGCRAPVRMTGTRSGIATSCLRAGSTSATETN